MIRQVRFLAGSWSTPTAFQPPTARPTSILRVLAKALRRSQDKIVMRSYLLGGAFGRRLDGDYAVPAALASLAIGGKPVKMVCTRADDMRFDCPRSASRQVLRLAWGDGNRVVAMDHHA